MNFDHIFRKMEVMNITGQISLDFVVEKCPCGFFYQSVEVNLS